MDVAVVDYGVSNLCSVLRALEYLGYDAALTSSPDELVRAERIILPGQGAFATAMHNLRQTGLDQALETARQAGKPIMGICVGMQIMAQVGWENGNWPGLGWLDAECRPLTPDSPDLKLPHVGWNEISCDPAEPLFAGLKPKDRCAYFVHSYALVCNQANDVIATCDYGGTFAAAVCKDNLFATQFHPEKSQENGLRILDNFLNWKP